MKVLWQIETDFPIVTNIIFPIFVMMLYCNEAFCHPLNNSQACIWLRPCRIALLFSWFLITLASAVVMVNQILIFVVQFKFFKNCIQPYGILTVFCRTSCPSLKIFPSKNVPGKKKWKQVCLMCCHGYVLYRHHIYMCKYFTSINLRPTFLFPFVFCMFRTCVCVLTISVVYAYIGRVETIVASCILI